MGTSTSKQARHTMCWIDFEGGIRGVPLWDAAVAIDGEIGGARGVRIVQPAKAAHMTKLKKSLPPKVFSTLQIGHATQVSYNHDSNTSKWRVSDSRQLSGNINKHLENIIPTGCTLAAWNMNGHDIKVMQSEIGEKKTSMYHTVDPLRFFKKHVGLPSNTLASKRAGTPRAVFQTPSFAYLGPEHSAFVDVLHMRDVTRKAAYAVMNASAGTIDIDNVHNKTEGEYALAIEASFAPKSRLQDPHIEPWMWSSLYWDGDTLRPTMSKEYKKKVVNWMKSNGRPVSKSMQNSINSVRKRKTVQKYLRPDWVLV